MSGERDPADCARIPFSLDDRPAAPVLLEVVDFSKSYGPVRAVRGLSLDVRVGEVHAICGHNGAGKSTLVKALVGLVRPDEGVIRFDGEELSLRNPHEAQAHGIALVNQELSLVPELSVEDNIFLGGLDVPAPLPAAPPLRAGARASSTSSASATSSSARRSRRSRSASGSSSRSPACSSATRACSSSTSRPRRSASRRSSACSGRRATSSRRAAASSSCRTGSTRSSSSATA